MSQRIVSASTCGGRRIVTIAETYVFADVFSDIRAAFVAGGVNAPARELHLCFCCVSKPTLAMLVREFAGSVSSTITITQCVVTQSDEHSRAMRVDARTFRAIAHETKTALIDVASACARSASVRGSIALRGYALTPGETRRATASPKVKVAPLTSPVFQTGKDLAFLGDENEDLGVLCGDGDAAWEEARAGWASASPLSVFRRHPRPGG